MTTDPLATIERLSTRALTPRPAIATVSPHRGRRPARHATKARLLETTTFTGATPVSQRRSGLPVAVSIS